LQYKSFPRRGTYRPSIDGADQGQTVDMYSPSGSYEGVASFGTKTFAANGTKQFRFTAVGKNAASSSYAGHFDKLILTGTLELSFETENLAYTTRGGDEGDSIAEVAALARRADVAIVYVGTNNKSKPSDWTVPACHCQAVRKSWSRGLARPTRRLWWC